MKIKHKGYEIECTREPCLGGWAMTYFSVFREEDGLEVVADFTEEEFENEMTPIIDLQKRVDEFIITEGKSEDLEDEYHITNEV